MVGSSKIIISGLPIKASAIPTLCLKPLDRVRIIFLLAVLNKSQRSRRVLPLPKFSADRPLSVLHGALNIPSPLNLLAGIVLLHEAYLSFDG